MANNIESFLNRYSIHTLTELKNAIKKYGTLLPVSMVYQAAEFLNPNRDTTAAYYTDTMICEYIYNELPTFENKRQLTILEPSVGAGNFLPYIAQKYRNNDIVEISIIDIDGDELKIAELIFETYYREKYPNVAIRYIQDDYLLYKVSVKKYDLIIGNPPYSKTKDIAKVREYKNNSKITKSSNMFVYFLEKAIFDGACVSLVIPKSFLNAPEYEQLRNIIKRMHIKSILDFGEKGFKGVKIETINLIIQTNETPLQTNVLSITKNIKLDQEQSYITDSKYPSWLIYRNASFDTFADTLELGMFNSFRDRQIVGKLVSNNGKYRVLKSRNLGCNEIKNISGYDKYIDDISGLYVAEYLNRDNIVLIPNLSYNPRACFLPKDTIADGSVALLTVKDGRQLSKDDLEVFATKEFCNYYRIARNYGTRSLNIDNNSVFFFGIRRK